MRRLAIIRLLAIIIGGVTLLMIPSLVLALIMRELFMLRAFIIPPAAGLVIAMFAFLFKPKTNLSLRVRDGFLLVILTWILSSLVCSFPYYLSPLGMSIYDAIFESASDFTTTGATAILDIETLPKSLLFWRSTCHWAGGMGIILLSVALMPLLGVGGIQLIKAEMTGPEKEKLKPRIAEAAKVLWGVYCVFTAILILLYRLGGMGWFDAVCNSFTVMSTGGVSTKNTGFAFYNSAFIDWVTIIFMLLGALSFNMYYKIVQGKFKELVQNTECKAYLLIFIFAAVVISVSLIPHYGSFGNALRFGSFEVASILSTTGNTRANYTAWLGLAQGVLFCLMFVGGCSGSTAGGIKVIRHAVLFKQAGNELRRILYPQGVFSIRLNGKVGRKDVVYGVAAFMFLYFVIVGVTTLATAASGFDIFSSFSAALCITGNIGAGFGAVEHYGAIPNQLKLFYSLVMITGRLELWTVFVFFSREYWKR
ncbi:MAG: TrkH family potassium uptake protein [Treponema sp.]|jgi:trk system potassium uptake protein TrkH|nr:TrkH family potassium uptake protein [Treponema sp.]